MNKYFVLFTIMALIAAVFISGCVEQGTTVSSVDDAGDVVEDVGETLEDVMSDLNDVEDSLGGEE